MMKVFVIIFLKTEMCDNITEYSLHKYIVSITAFLFSQFRVILVKSNTMGNKESAQLDQE